MSLSDQEHLRCVSWSSSSQCSCRSHDHPPPLFGCACGTEGLFPCAYVDNFDFLIVDPVEMVQVLAPSCSKSNRLVLRIQLERSRCWRLVRTLGNSHGLQCGACNGVPCRIADLSGVFLPLFVDGSAGQRPSVNDVRETVPARP